MTASNNRAAVFVGGGVAPGSAVEALLSREAALQLASLDFVCCDAGSASAYSPSTSYALGLSATAQGSQHDRDRLGRIAKALAPGAKLYVYEAASSGVQGRPDALSKDLVLSGFQACEVLPASGDLLVLARMPAWQLGAKAALSLQPRAQQQPPQAAAASAWTVNADDEDEDELIDEAALLTEADKARPAPVAQPDDCEVGTEGRKACKNCSCGRAEAEAQGIKAQLTPEMLENPQSSCGNCGLGDAFRCGGCPYRGLPAFQPGKKIELPSDFLAADF